MEIMLLVRKEPIPEEELYIMIMILKQVNTLHLPKFIMIKVLKKISTLILQFMQSLLVKFLLLQENKLLLLLEIQTLIGMENKKNQTVFGMK